MNEMIQLPSNSELYLKYPLYTSIDLGHLSSEERQSYLKGIKNPEDTIDAICVECRKQSTFTGHEIQFSAATLEGYEWGEGAILGVEFRCTRDLSHRMYFIFRCINGFLVKIGQHPSIADLSDFDIEQYKKILSNERFRELSKAIGLASHGIGIGAFVYLRRIFEDLIEEAHTNAKLELADWNEELYQDARVDEKIQILRGHLPSFLIQNKHLYSILSKGIHSLSEGECLENFDVVKVGIELILDEKLEEKRKQEKISRIQKSLNIVHQKFKT